MRYLYFDDTPIPMYLLMGLAGYMAAMLIVLIKRRTFTLHIREVIYFTAFAAFGILGGARALGVIVQTLRRGFVPNFWDMQRLLNLALKSGWVFYGGLIGGFCMLFLLAKLKRMNMKSIFNAYAYVLLAYLVFARVGCYCAGCCYGITLASGALFPTQLVEAGFCFVMLLVFLIVKPERRWPSIPLLPVYTVIYSVMRFALEFYRGDANRGIWLLSTSQWIALALIPLSIVWLIKRDVWFQPKKIIET